MDIQDFMVDRDQHMRPLEYDLSENFNELVRYLNDVGVLDNIPVGVTAESEIASVSDAYPAPPRALNVYGKSTQAGTPTPDAPVPILSVDDLALCMCGVNRMHIDASTSGVTETDGVFEGSINALNDALRCPYPIPAGSAFTVDVRATETGSGNLNFIAVRADNGGRLYLASPPNTQTTWATYTYAINYPVSEIYLYHNASGNRVWQFRNLCVRADGSTVYEPYQGQSVPDLLPEGTSLRSLPDGTRDQLSLSYLRPSTRAGWAWYERELVQVVGENTIANACNWSIDTNPQVFLSRNFVSDMAEDSHSTGILVMCDKLAAETARAYSQVSSMTDNSICKRGTLNKLFVKTGVEYGSVDNFLSALGDAVIYYPLATPTTTQLDPIELPQLPAPNATVWCDGGSAQPTLMLEYVRDTNTALADLSEAIADIVSG